METVFLRVLNISVSATVLILAVILLRTLLRDGAKSVRCILWAFVWGRLVIPFYLQEVSEGIRRLSEMIYGAFDKNLIAKVAGSTNGSAARMVQKNVTDSVQTEVVNALGGFVQVQESAVLFLPAYMVSFGSMIWACGCVILLTYAIVNYLLLKKKVQASVLLYENIRICDGIRTPFLLGYRKPQIFLPSDINRAQLSYIVAHESVHLKRRDYIWKTLAYAVAVLHWFNPFVWVAWHLFCKDLELSCDEKAIQKLGQKGKEGLCLCLISVQ